MEIIGARYVLPIAGPPILEGAIAIEGAKIIAVGTQKELAAQYPDAPFRRFDHHALMPGLVNTHACLDMSVYNPEEIPARYIEWQIEALEFRREQSAVKRRAAILEGLQRALSWGVTTIADTSNYSGILETVKEAGLRLLVSPEITGAPKKEQQAHYDAAFELVDDIRELNLARIRPGIAPYSPYALSRQLLTIISQHARGAGLPVSLRAASSFSEMEFFYESKGEIADIFFPRLGWEEERPLAQRKTPIQFLAEVGFLRCRPLLVGCTHLAEDDFATIKGSGCKVAHLPASARYFDLGLAPVRKLRAQGVSVGLGTGTFGAATQQSVWDLLRAALKLHGDIANESLSAEELLRMATLEGAQAIGWNDVSGSIEANKAADFIVVETNDKLPLEQVALTLINETTPERITKIYVDGVSLK